MNTDHLSQAEISNFEDHGFVRLDNAFSQETAAAAREILWRETGCDPNDRATWTTPVIRLAGYGGGPFETAINTPRLHTAFDQLVGAGRWQRRSGIGTFPIRFPSLLDPGDTGWHIDGSFTGHDGNYWVNVFSKDRALLMLFLFSDVSEEDAPTRILVGSHLDIPAMLMPLGEEGMSFFEVSKLLTTSTLNREVTLATGEAGTVYLCHPFLVHGAQPHRGNAPRFLAQPPLLGDINIHRKDGALSPVERAILAGMS